MWHEDREVRDSLEAKIDSFRSCESVPAGIREATRVPFVLLHSLLDLGQDLRPFRRVVVLDATREFVLSSPHELQDFVQGRFPLPARRVRTSAAGRSARQCALKAQT